MQLTFFYSEIWLKFNSCAVLVTVCIERFAVRLIGGNTKWNYEAGVYLSEAPSPPKFLSGVV